MKSIERRSNNIKEKKNGWSSYACFAEAVTGQKFTGEAIRRWFNKLVDKDDYASRDKRAILAHLQNLTNAVTTPRNRGKSRA
jgi:hypothetical protein